MTRGDHCLVVCKNKKQLHKCNESHSFFGGCATSSGSQGYQRAPAPALQLPTPRFLIPLLPVSGLPVDNRL